MEVALCGLGLLVLSPLLLLIAILVKLSSPGPVLFRQTRVGQHGRPFSLYKFRSMVDRPAGGGPLVTAGGDRRITKVGRVLRGAKLDELPQLWNVIRGDMSLVGPRPEVPRYVEHYPGLFSLALEQRPGITDVCTLQLRNEEQMLAIAADPERYYIEKLLPRKLAASIREGWKRTVWRDLRVILATLLPPLRGLAPLPDFRPLADLYTLPISAPPAQRVAAAVDGGETAAAGASQRRARVGA
jgi:lipopolysaccharide/colanic/teichoic acid biosynthesis glycosyltransferase